MTSHTAGLQATGVFSNISTTGDITGAWQNQSIGIQSNAAEQMYVKITDGAGQSATVPNPDPNAAQVTEWTEWGEFGQGIALTEFMANNPSLNPANIASMTIGFGPPAGGSGLVFFDDIRLYASRCVPELVESVGGLNDNCIVDLPDLEMMTVQWLDSGPDLETDINTDEVVDFVDYALLTEAWLEEMLWP